MAELGIVTGSEVKTDLDGDKPSRILQVQISTDEDVQSVELYRMPGEDYNPSDGTKVLIIEIGTSKAAIAAADVAAVDDLAKGEREYYSDDGEARLATIRLDAESQVILNDGADNAVQFSAMQTAFDNLKSELNALVTAYNAHIHITTATVGATATPGVIAPTTTQGTAPAADMSGAKVDKVRLP